MLVSLYGFDRHINSGCSCAFFNAHNVMEPAVLYECASLFHSLRDDRGLRISHLVVT
jgi:hypothetical protein